MSNINLNYPHPVLHCTHLSKTYIDGEISVPVLTDINFTVQPGERIAILGRSGSGKSTFLHLLGGLDKSSTGQVWIDNNPLHELNEKQRCQLRNHKLGFIYQFHHLLPEFTALENVAMPLLIRNEPLKQARSKAIHMLERVGLGDRIDRMPSQLSGGERQRTAIARALVTDPICLLADEPTGNLDYHTAHTVCDTLLDLNQTLKTSLILATHDLNLAKKMDRILQLKAGRLIEADIAQYLQEAV